MAADVIIPALFEPHTSQIVSSLSRPFTPPVVPPANPLLRFACSPLFPTLSQTVPLSHSACSMDLFTRIVFLSSRFLSLIVTHSCTFVCIEIRPNLSLPFAPTLRNLLYNATNSYVSSSSPSCQSCLLSVLPNPLPVIICAAESMPPASSVQLPLVSLVPDTLCSHLIADPSPGLLHVLGSLHRTISLLHLSLKGTAAVLPVGYLVSALTKQSSIAETSRHETCCVSL